MSEIKASDFKFGYKTHRYNAGNNGWFRQYFCSCGTCGRSPNSQSNRFRYNDNYVCQSCGNHLFSDPTLSVNNIASFPSIKIIQVDDKKIHFSRQNVSVKLDKDSLELFTFRKTGVSREVDLDIIDETLKVTRRDSKSTIVELNVKNGEMIQRDSVETKGVNNSSLFAQIRKLQPLIAKDIGRENLIYMVTNQNTKYLLDSCRNKFRDEFYRYFYSYQSQYSDNFLGAMYRMTYRDMKKYQTLASAGVPQAISFAPENLNLEETKPHSILGVNKKFMKWFKKYGEGYAKDIMEIGLAMKRYNPNFTDEILEIIEDESNIRAFANSLTAIESLIEFGYNDVKALILYLARHCRMHQGMTITDASTYLRDYVRMQNSLGLEHEKYPKSLKREHDVASMNTRVLENKNDNYKFKAIVSEKPYNRLLFEKKNEKFKIMKPEGIEDLKREGEELSHCVASYVKDVTAERCKILFLRDKENESEPLVTIEVRGHKIRQARGQGNRSVTNEQKEFIKLWAKEKDLIESYY